MGMALTSCTVPHAGQPTFDLPEDQMEIGVGIHGEPGRTRMELKSADEITEMLTLPIPVSYTHLDVYKRQVPGRGRGSSTAPRLSLIHIYRRGLLAGAVLLRDDSGMRMVAL